MITILHLGWGWGVSRDPQKGFVITLFDDEFKDLRSHTYNFILEPLFCAFGKLERTSLLKPEQLIVSREQELTSLSGFKYTRVCLQQLIY